MSFHLDVTELFGGLIIVGIDVGVSRFEAQHLAIVTLFGWIAWVAVPLAMHKRAPLNPSRLIAPSVWDGQETPSSTASQECGVAPWQGQEHNQESTSRQGMTPIGCQPGLPAPREPSPAVLRATSNRSRGPGLLVPRLPPSRPCVAQSP